MPLSVAVTGLEAQIKAAFEKARDVGASDGDNSSDVIATLASELATAINTYTTQAFVQVTVVNTAVVGVGGLYPGPVVGTGVGTGTGILI
jgi:hypothetical protein